MSVQRPVTGQSVEAESRLLVATGLWWGEGWLWKVTANE